ncbi:DUF7674 family protein [Acutalibacter caecimuris]|uniref:DUF7674 family protein n=1 Tax=Acutalibacter caecimuris TaxID=3093657 RepID=UPI002AC899BA|nr:hypothetical protein [Acutalibacter sp. M00118]
MDFNAFELIQTALGAELTQQGFEEPVALEDAAGRASMFRAADVAYSLLYATERKSFVLRSTTLTADSKPGDWRELSAWLFDMKTADRSDAESIINDFLEVVRGPKRVAVVQQRKKAAKGEDRTVDPLFFINRLANIFPEIKGELNEEKIVYGQVRYITFLKAHVIPRADDLLQKYPDSEPADKLCALLDDMYKNGDMDLRSIISFTFLNGLSDGAFQAAQGKLEDELKKHSGYSRKLKGKNIKPEKKKKAKGKKVEARLEG